MPGRGVRSAVLPSTPSQQRSAELLTAACPVIDTQIHTQANKNLLTSTNEDLNTELSHYIGMEEMSLPYIYISYLNHLLRLNNADSNLISVHMYV